MLQLNKIILNVISVLMELNIKLSITTTNFKFGYMLLRKFSSGYSELFASIVFTNPLNEAKTLINKFVVIMALPNSRRTKLIFNHNNNELSEYYN